MTGVKARLQSRRTGMWPERQDGNLQILPALTNGLGTQYHVQRKWYRIMLTSNLKISTTSQVGFLWKYGTKTSSPITVYHCSNDPYIVPMKVAIFCIFWPQTVKTHGMAQPQQHRSKRWGHKSGGAYIGFVPHQPGLSKGLLKTETQTQMRWKAFEWRNLKTCFLQRF